MVSMFQAIMASGLEGFLGCPAVIYEAALVDFFENASVRDGVLISTVAGQLVEISEEWFAESFDLPVDGLADLSEIPKDVVFDARSIVSMSGEPVSLSGKKSQMKVEYRLLCDIMAKSISVKAGSFNAITVEKFSMETAVVCGVRMNWARVLFNILKNMVTPGSKQAKGFAVQISLLLENIPNLELGESSEFPASKILTEKLVHRYVSLNDKGGAKEAADAPQVKKAPKKRPAAADFEAPVVKKKRTMKKKSEDEIPADPPADEVAGETADVEAADEVSNDEPAAGDATRINEPTTQPAVTEFVNEEPSTADDVDIIIEQVLADTAQISVDEEEQVVRTLGEGNQPAGTAKEPQWFDLPYVDLIARWDAERPVVTASDTDEEEETMDVGAAGGDQQVQFSVEEPEGMEMSDELIDADEKMSLDEILLTIPAELTLPSAAWEVTKITIGTEIKIPGVDEKTWYLASLPQIPVDAKGKEPLQFKDPIKGKPPQEHYYLICADIDLLVQLQEKIIDEVAEFFYSFSLKRLALQIDESYLAKEELVLSWAEAESTGVALQRKMYILLKYRALLYSLFNRLTTADISSFVASIASERTVLRNVQIAQDTVSVALIVQLIYEHSSSDSTSDAISMDFAAHDTAITASISLPAAPSPNIIEALNQLRALIDQIRERDDGGAKHKDTLLLHLHDFEKQVIARLDAQDRVLGALHRDSNDQCHLLSLELQYSHKQLGTQIVTTGLDVVDVRRVVRENHQELNAKINSLDEQVAATRNDLLDFSAQAQHTLNIITSQLSELVAYINRGGNAKKGEGESSRGPQPPPAVQIRDSGNTCGSGDVVRTTELTQAYIDAANRKILERMMREDRE
ncbi:hypothetical protein F511_40018 [Dorcoceras hygrometricum]|uniref:Dystroglycan-like n=1 Tax=Dorcoceras hygrometricum TaxID=472368 RepID=A0A2Z7D312_9LAMI|nr:hypothetical protein F511_40018 [Dorcoceras hygrometricum]